jgi:hypothetical protein
MVSTAQGPDDVPLGARLRLASTPAVNTLINNMPPESQIVARAMQQYGLIVADIGSAMYVSGASASVDANNNINQVWDLNDIFASNGLEALHAGDFEVVNLAPILTGLSASSGAAGSQLTITGQNFSGAAGRISVFFGGVAASSVNVVSDTQISVIVPNGSGTVDVTVQSGLNETDNVSSNPNANVNAPIFGYGTSAVSPADKFTYTPSTTPAVVTSVSSTTANGTYGTGAGITVTVAFNKPVNVTGNPILALNSGGTATYTSESANTLSFSYVVAAGQNTPALDAASTNALTMNGGTIQDSTNTAANLTLPAPGLSGSLSANKSIAIDTTAPTVVSYSVDFGTQAYNLVGAPRTTHLPWLVTGITVTFSKPIGTATAASLSGISATGLSGTPTTLTWTFPPISNATLSTSLAGSGTNAIKDKAGNGLAGGAGFSQMLSVLYGDFNGDGVVTAADLVGDNFATKGAYNVIADINGDGVVNVTDVTIIKTRQGATQQ